MTAKRGGRKAPAAAAPTPKTRKPRKPATPATPPPDDPFGDKEFLERKRVEALTPREKRLGITSKGEKLKDETPGRSTAAPPPPSVEPSTPATPRRKAGRPSIYDPAMCDRLIECGEQGMTKIEMAVALGINRDTLYAWASDPKKPDFVEAFVIACELSEAFHARDFRERCHLPSTVYNAAGKTQFMKTVFKDWRVPDKVAVEGSPDGPPIKAEIKVEFVRPRAA
ncbi:MAG: hypothetical protein EBZ50_05180 [Alphaproteobacteria bacterium]|nr:hypothetical protein [Alphaproteobacteria bacterium]